MPGGRLEGAWRTLPGEGILPRSASPQLIFDLTGYGGVRYYPVQRTKSGQTARLCLAIWLYEGSYETDW